MIQKIFYNNLKMEKIMIIKKKLKINFMKTKSK